MDKKHIAERTRSSPQGDQLPIRPRSHDEGVSAIEYALIAALIALVIVIAVVALGSSMESLYSNIATHVSSASS
jgi:pilus assembly protein Flp/PilA